MSKFDLNIHTARLLMNEPFFAALSRRIDKRPTSAIPTAGVKVNDNGHFELAYNPEFFDDLSDKEMAGVLKHELYHLIFEHVIGTRIVSATGDKKITKMWNVATDLAINSHLEGELPDGCLFPGKGEFEDFDRGLSAEQYFELLKDKYPQKDDEGEGQGEGQGEGEGVPDTFDDHSGWGEGDNTSQEIAKQRLKEAVKKAANEAAKCGNWGSVSGECRRDILNRITAKVDWKKVLRYFIKT